MSLKQQEGFRVNTRVQQVIERRKRARLRRLRHEQWQDPDSVGSANIKYEMSERATANIAFNLLAGGQCLDHIELLRQDEAYLNGIGVERIPDPTTAGDYCRRFDRIRIDRLMDAFNETRARVWKAQPESFRDCAIIDADGVMVETYGRCKQGIDINYKKQWGYHPLIVSLANTAEPLFIVNRSGNRPSHEGAAEYIDRAIALCREAGFKKIVVRGDTDFTQTKHLDRWDGEGVTFVFGIDAMQNLYEEAEKIEESEWEVLERRAREVRTKCRRKKVRYKDQIVRERGYKKITLEEEYVAEIRYRPTKCKQEYRVIVLWKELTVSEGQPLLFSEENRCFFYITNDWDSSPEEIVASSFGFLRRTIGHRFYFDYASPSGDRCDVDGRS